MTNRLTARHVTTGASAGHNSRFFRSVFTTVPILLVSSLAVTLGAVAPADASVVRKPLKQRAQSSDLARTLKHAVTGASRSANERLARSAPSSYRVQGGDTVSSIAGRFGLSTASVLALNGLGWKSTIFPGQHLRLSKNARVSVANHTVSSGTGSAHRYAIVTGDTVGSIAARFDVSVESVLTANGLSHSSVIYAGSHLVIPRADGRSIRTTPTVSTRPIAHSGTGTSSAARRSYVIAVGDTISAIAAKFHVAPASILAANNLSDSAIIFPGRSLVIPAVSVDAHGNAILSPEMKSNARVIIRVGRELGVSDFGIVVALSAAMQESKLRNLDYGDRDSVGLFQQRPSMGWGTAAELRSPSHASRLFYGGLSNPNHGVTNGLLNIDGWEAMTVTRAAQAVQVSAHPHAYAQWEKSARAWLADLG